MAVPNFISTKSCTMSRINALVYGQSGVGKTTLCGTAPRPLILSAEAGLLSLRDKDIPAVVVSTVDDISNVFEWLQTDQAKSAIDTICMDSITEIAEVVLANAAGQLKDKRQAYAEVVTQMSALVRGFRDLPYNVLMIAQEENVKDGDGFLKSGPSMPGQKLGQKSPYFFDLVMRLAVGQTEDGKTFRYLQCQPTPNVIAKDRSGMLDATMYPDFSHVISKMLGKTA